MVVVIMRFVRLKMVSELVLDRFELYWVVCIFL